MKNAEITNIENVIDNLESLSDCLLEGEDYCSVSIVQGGIETIKEQLELNIRRRHESPLVVTNKQLHSLAHWITGDMGLLGTTMVLGIISVLRKRLPQVLGVVIDE